MPAQPDPRWANIVGGISPAGIVIPMSFEELERIAAEWPGLLDSMTPPGISKLFETSRSLFAHAWFNYDFMAVASLVAFQAVEATLRQVVYPSENEGTAFGKLVARAAKEGRLTPALRDLLDTGAELRNLLSHPHDQIAFTLPVAGSMIENSHRFVTHLVATTRAETNDT